MTNKKTCVITGANSGIGLATARALAAKGWKIGLICRNREKASATRDQLQANCPEGTELYAYGADLSSQTQIRSAAEKINDDFNYIDVLINNAGAVYSEFQLSEDQIEMQFAINHLAYFLLTQLLLDSLKRAKAARIINVSSDSHYRGKIHFDDLNLQANYHPLKAYEQSKLANVLFSNELADRLQTDGISVNSLHPGVVKTKIGNKHSKSWHGWLWSLFSSFGIQVDKGAETSVYLATSDEVAGVTGKYFDKCKAKKPSRLARDRELRRELWKKSEQLVKNA